MNKLVVISGIAGMTGSMVTKFLLEKDFVVVGFDNFFCSTKETIKEYENCEKFHFFEYDIRNKEQMKNLFSFVENKFKNYSKYYINCAAVVHTKHFYEPDNTFEVNVICAKESLNQAIENDFERYINCSTSEVYSMKSYVEGGIKEESPVLLATAEQSLRTSYATGKLMTEFFTKDAVEKGKIKACSIRFANVYSAKEYHNDHIIPHIISSLQKSNEITLLENAKDTRRTFLNNIDSAKAVVELLETESALDGSVYNVGTQDEIYIVDLAKKIAKFMNIENLKINFEGTRTADPKRRFLNTDKIQQKTKWKQTVSLDDGLIECIKDRLNNER